MSFGGDGGLSGRVREGGQLGAGLRSCHRELVVRRALKGVRRMHGLVLWSLRVHCVLELSQLVVQTWDSSDAMELLS